MRSSCARRCACGLRQHKSVSTMMTRFLCNIDQQVHSFLWGKGSHSKEPGRAFHNIHSGRVLAGTISCWVFDLVNDLMTNIWSDQNNWMIYMKPRRKSVTHLSISFVWNWKFSSSHPPLPGIWNAVPETDFSPTKISEPNSLHLLIVFYKTFNVVKRRTWMSVAKSVLSQ